jgi:hypothetical protein
MEEANHQLPLYDGGIAAASKLLSWVESKGATHLGSSDGFSVVIS